MLAAGDQRQWALYLRITGMHPILIKFGDKLRPSVDARNYLGLQRTDGCHGSGR